MVSVNSEQGSSDLERNASAQTKAKRSVLIDGNMISFIEGRQTMDYANLQITNAGLLNEIRNSDNLVIGYCNVDIKTPEDIQELVRQAIEL